MKTKVKTIFSVFIILFATIMPIAVLNFTSGNRVQKITYQLDDENEFLSVTAKVGEKIYAPEQPTKDGYVFEGWLLGDEPYVFDVMPDEDIVLTAKWNKLYHIDFSSGTEENVASIVATANTVIEEPQIEREGYLFEGWLLNSEPYEFTVMPEENLFLTASWVKLYTITFSTGSEECKIAPIVETADTQITAPQVNRQGYFFRGWKLNNEYYNFNVMPSEDLTLVADWEKLTNLPAMFIDLKNNSGEKIDLSSVTKETYVNSSISLLNTKEKFAFNNVSAKFKGRGNGSWSDDKKGYKIKFDKKQSLFGHAANKHWVIIACANFDDGTMYRDYLAYSIGREVLDGIEYTTTTELIDIYVNGEYRGVYLLCEHVRVGKGRVDIDSDYGLNDTGYLIEYDAYATGENGVDYFTVPGLKYAFTVHSPDPEEYLSEGKITKEVYQQQVAYIQDYVAQVYTAALNGDYETFTSLVDVDSFVDMYLLHELFKNTDTGWSSFYLYKKPGGKLYAGPAWDFDATTTSARGDNTPQGIYVAGAVVDQSDFTASELYISLYQTAGFKQAVIDRWQEISDQIADFINETLSDEMFETNKNAMGKNFALWKNKTQEAAENYWVNQITILKQWLLSRIAWLDSEWQ